MHRGAFATRVRALRGESGLSQEKAAKEMGVSYKTLLHMENDQKTPLPKTVAKVARFYGVPLDELLELLDDGPYAGKGPAFELEGEEATEVKGREVEIVGSGPTPLAMVRVDLERLEWVLMAVEDGKLTPLEAKHLLTEVPAAR
jgi:transcriptional regulator with XRE-family HTH domain